MSEPVTVGGRYELGDLLGRGGMAEVRHAIDRRLGRAVAVKQLRTDLATDPTFQARFRREAQSAAGLNHPTIVAVYDTGEETDPVTGVSIPYIVMELVEGPTLRDILRDGRKILPERALELTAGVLDALSYSHKAGIIHRDIKPANVMLTPSGGVKVMDFGIARAVADTSATMTQTAAVIGTAQYLSPEQARGETVDARSDIYSAGCLLYELLVGRPPFTGESPVSVAYQHVREAPVPLTQLDPEITPEIDAVTLKALAKDPADRYQSAREMKADITRVLAGQQTTAAVPRVEAPVARPAAHDTPTRVVAPVPVVEDDADIEEPRKRRAGLVVLITALILLVLGIGAFALYQVLENQTPAVVKVEVPNLQGYKEEQAAEQLASRKLVMAVEHVNGDEESKDTVIAQAPLTGTQVDEGSTVTVTVNDGPKTGTVPSGLVGEDVNDVKQELADADFTNVDAVAAKSEDPDAKPGQVIRVSPKSGTVVPLDDEITITYATGKSAVPDFIGSTEAKAKELARAAGFGTPTFTERESNQVAGTVIAQNPKADSSVDRGTEIQLVIATAPAPSPTPTPTPTASSSPTSSPEPTDDPTN